MTDLETRRVLITGCASGIGLALTDRLAGAGASIFATDLDGGSLRDEATARGWDGSRVHTAGLDVRDPSRWDAAVRAAHDAMGGLDLLVNVAGVIQPAWVHELDLEQARLQVDVNFMGVVTGMRAVTPRFVAQGHGHVINVASMAALAPIEGIAIYSATKYAVRGYSLAAAQELRRRGVFVSVVCPDAVRTPMLEQQERFEEAAMTFSGPRELSPAEVAEAIVEAIERRPLELYLPRHRGWLARVVDIFPRSASAVGSVFRKRGEQRRHELRNRRTSEPDDA